MSDSPKVRAIKRKEVIASRKEEWIALDRVILSRIVQALVDEKIKSIVAKGEIKG